MAGEDDVTVLFESNTVQQVQEILTKTRNDIEWKKEDLRVMVGERYRDLIEAADTIAEMQESAKAICGNIQRMEGLCESLQQRGLIGFKTKNPPSAGSERLSSSRTHYSLAVQVKLLVTIPEILWSLTEHGQYLHAMQLLLLAHHTHTALQLSPKATKVSSWFPVIERQWTSITQFKSTIVRGCSILISTEVDDVQAVLDAMVSIMLVEGCSTSELLARVLDLRHASLMAIVGPKPSATAKAQISRFVMLFIASLNIIYAVFAEKEEGKSLLEHRLQEIVKGEADDSSPVSLLQESSLALSFLPLSIRQFRPIVHGSTEALGNEYVRSQVVVWLNSVLSQVSTSLSTLLSFTTSIKALSLIRSSVWEICQEKIDWDFWNKITVSLYGEDFDPWESLVRNPVTERARQVISTQLTSAKEAIIQMVAKLASDITLDPKIAHEEGDVTNFVWSESIGDLPERVGWTSAASRTISQAGGLYYKTRGYTNRLQTICRALNSRLNSLMQDVSNFSNGMPKGEMVYQFEMDKKAIAKDQNTAEDYKSLLNFLQDASCCAFIELISELEKMAKHHKSTPAPETHTDWDEDLDNSVPSPASTILVVVGRLCQALPNVCPQMQVCASASYLINPDISRRVSMGSKIDSEPWAKVLEELQNTSSVLFGLFLTSLTSTLHAELKAALASELSSSEVVAAISALPTWESVSIEEEGDTGDMVKSSIHVPAHPTPALTQSLAQLCSSVNCVAAHTITRNAQVKLVLNVCESVTSAYENSLEDTNQMNQTLALQLIFDLRFVQTILLPRESRDMGTRLTTMIHKLEHNVDPFDLDVFSPHISTRVKLAAHRVQVVLGTVLTRDRQVVPGRTQSSASSSPLSNNALPIILAVEIPRFSNVPLPVSSMRSCISSPALSMSMADGISNKMSSSKEQINPSPVRREVSTAMSASRSAASLFSAMSSSWFGGSSSSSS